jgi:uncharacterized alkaline shock family protein YloU
LSDQPAAGRVPGDDVSTRPLPGSDPSVFIADGIVVKVAADAARGVRGVSALVSRRRRLAALFGGRRDEVEVRMQDGAVEIALGLIVAPDTRIPAVVEAVREAVAERVRFTTGLDVRRVQVSVLDVAERPGGAPG